MQRSIKDLVRALQQDDLRMDQMDEGFTENETSMLTLMTSMTGEVKVKNRSTISGNASDLSQLSNWASVCSASATAANEQRHFPTQKESGRSVFRAKMPLFDRRSRWQAYLLQFQTILFMYQCNDERVMVDKLVEALRDKALDYFENLQQL